ncbi:MAG: RNA polymerase sporulation sigma factor SigK [Lachnospiraceae bacterium]|nr:RNA polymerase sporulation sigma factor SigK [Lachnospiraceae bacterium]MDD6505479.1 RNA polymerase sporulation sigma factor SigK [Lachnospiraceae bacterium]
MEPFLSPLSVEEERDCLERLQNSDETAREKLILHNMRLVAHVVKRYGSSAEDPEDLISIGTIGLLKAVNTFHPDKGSKFSTYAIRCIENEILMFFRSRKKMRSEVSIFEPIGTDKEGHAILLYDVLESENADFVLMTEQKSMMQKMMENLDRILTPRELEIIGYRYGVGGKKELTQREIATRMNISRSYVSRIEKRALGKIRKYLNE